jgi:hypothetical protein
MTFIVSPVPKSRTKLTKTLWYTFGTAHDFNTGCPDRTTIKLNTYLKSGPKSESATPGVTPIAHSRRSTDPCSEALAKGPFRGIFEFGFSKKGFCPSSISSRKGLLLKSAVLPRDDVGHGVGSGMLASILLVGRSPWSRSNPSSHDRLLDGRAVGPDRRSWIFSLFATATSIMSIPVLALTNPTDGPPHLTLLCGMNEFRCSVPRVPMFITDFLPPATCLTCFRSS